MRTPKSVPYLAVLVMGSALLSSAQVATGTPAFGSFGGGPADTVNLGNLNVHLAIPAIRKAGRGMPFYYTLSYDSSVWYPTLVNGINTWQPAANWGWRGQTEVVMGYISHKSNRENCPNPEYPPNPPPQIPGFYLDHYVYHDSFGISHPFNITVHLSEACGGGFPETGTATDGSGYKITTDGTTASITSPSGTVFTPPVGAQAGASTATDSNGNRISVNSSGVFTDTLGTTVLTVTGSGTQASPLSFAYANPAGGSSSVVMHYTNKTVRTYFRCTGGTAVADYPATANVPLVSDVTLPDGSKYLFTYELSGDPNSPSSVTGRVKTITLPTGGTITYTYAGGTNGINCTDGSAMTLTRVLSPGGSWSYTRTAGAGNSWTTVIQDPDSPSNKTTITFQKDSRADPSNIYNNFYETSRVVNQGASTVLQTMYTCYNGNGLGPPLACSTTAVSSPISRRTIFTYLPDSSGRQSKADVFYNGYGLVTEADEYDSTVGAVGSLVRKTIISYAALNNGIVNRPSNIVIKDINNNVKANTTYTYDEGSVTATSGTPQHVGVTGSRGNLTTSAAQADSTTTLYRKFTYYDTGNLKTSSDFNTANAADPARTTTYNYAAGVASCYNSFVTSLSEPLSLSRSFTWDCTGGVQKSVTDENSKITTFTYNDPKYWRMTGVSYPDGGSTSITYNTGATTPWNITRSAAIDGTRNLTSETVLDGLGRPQQNQLTSDPNGTSYVDTVYDAVGRVQSVSNPYYTSGDTTYGITSYNYDALGRTTKITRPDTRTVLMTYSRAAVRVQDESKDGTNRITKVSQIDGLGRLVKVCEVTGATQMGSGGAPVDCLLDLTGTGFLTSYTYDILGNLTGVTQNGMNNRIYGYDMLSRLTSETNPESGVTTYSYDTGRPGDLYRRIRPKPNQASPSVKVTSTYTFDVLNRLTGTTHDDGTSQVGFVYDETTGAGHTLSNPKGRLTHVGGAVGGGGVYTAATYFSYDPMGRVMDDYQYTPMSSSSSTQMHYAYDYLGDVITHTNYKENVTYTSSYDAAVRFTRLQSSLNDATHPGTLLTVNAYNALGLVTQATFGNGIVRNLGYDNRGRLTSLADGSLYSFTLGYAPDSNILTGNDSLNGNWTYTYDDFGRLATSGKTGQAFEYKYDQFSNRWQQNVTQGSGPAPQYTFDANNHITTSGVTYDAAGNILNDGFHAYTYDAEGRVLTVDGSTISYAYDAIGQRVSKVVSGVEKDYIYDHAGRAVSELGSGGAWARGEVYAGGMQVATYVSNTTYFHHTDWLGTLRALSDPSGVAVVTCTSLAYGDSQSCNSTYSALNYTGQWWDSESNLTHFLFRQLSTTQGRWTTPDPAGMGAVSPGNPQSWNRYAYVGNNPLVFTDPLGLCFAALIDVDGNTVACYDPAGGPLVGGNMFADPPVIWIGGWPGWLGGGGWPGGGGGTGGGGSGFLPGDGVPWWDMPVPADPLTSYLWSLTNFVLFGTPIDFTQFASPTLDNSFQAPANEGTASNICRQACRAEHSACRAIGKVSGWWQNLANFWPGKGFWGGTVQGVGGPGNPASSKAAGPPILINGKDASDIGGAVSDHCDQDALICNDSCKPANVPRTFPL